MTVERLAVVKDFVVTKGFAMVGSFVATGDLDLVVAGFKQCLGDIDCSV